MVQEEEVHWVVRYTDFEFDVFTNYWSYKLSGDTMVNGTDYKKLYYRHLVRNPDNYEVIFPYQYQSEELAALIREDTIERKVYIIRLTEIGGDFWDCSLSEEVVLFDFTTEIGATQSFCQYYTEQPTTLTNIFEGENNWGVFRHYFWGSGELIEQIGTSNGLLESPLDNVSGWSKQLIDYCIGTDEECHFNKWKPYKHLVRDYATWVVSYDDVEATPWIDSWHSYQIRWDVEIDGVSYKRVFYRDLKVNNETHEVIFPYEYSNERLIGYIREDLAERKVYYIKTDENSRPHDCPLNEEFLLYDFSFELGAEQEFCHFFGEFPSELSQIDTINTQWGTFPNYTWNEGELVEQIGSLYGLLETPRIPNVSGFWENLYDYCIGSDEDCDFISPALEVAPWNAEKYPKVSPNPFANDLIINDLQSWETLRIYDALGREVWRSSHFSEQVEVPANVFPTSGMYYLQATNEREMATVLLIKT